MSHVSAVSCPLSDCTLAVDNAENIRNSSDKVLLGLKADVVAPSPRKNARNAKYANTAATIVVEKAPSVRREHVVGPNTRKSNARTVTVVAAAPTLASAALEAHRPSALDMHVFAKPFTPSATPRRNDPYSLCLLSSPCTPEDGFYACYCDVTAIEAETADSLHSPVRPAHAAAQKAATLGDTTRNLLEMLSLVSTPSKSTLTSPERIAPSPQPTPSTSTRVVRKVVCCNVDRTSGRPVPKPKAA